jgi:hypothetical protein
MSDHVYTCPCGAVYSVNPHFEGRAGRCLACGQRILFSDTEENAPPLEEVEPLAEGEAPPHLDPETMEQLLLTHLQARRRSFTWLAVVGPFISGLLGLVFGALIGASWNQGVVGGVGGFLTGAGVHTALWALIRFRQRIR